MYFKTVLTDSNMCDSDFMTHKGDEFTEENDCKDDCIIQQFEPNDFLLPKIATRKQ
jgi:hypothetical protein